MADIIPFAKPTPKSKNKSKPTVSKKKVTMAKDATSNKQSGNTLCKSGFHKWKADKHTDFAVKQGKLLTRYICERCGKTKIETT